jgi:hypothetical protein
MRRLIILTCLLSGIFIFFSCNNDEDENEPVITILGPEEGLQVFIPDTLAVQFKVTDDRSVISVYVSILDENNIQIVQPVYFYPDSTSITAEALIPLTDKSLETGSYTIIVSASDGSNEVKAFRLIMINELPVELTGYIAVTSQLGLECTVYGLDPGFEIDTQFVLPETPHLTAVHSMWEKFYFITDEPSVITSFDLKTYEASWDASAYPPRPVITDIVSDKEFMYSSANGDVTLVDRGGNIIIRSVPYENKTITHLAADNNYIYAAHASLSGDINELTVLYRVTGEIREQKLLSAPIAGIVAFQGAAYVFLHSGDDIAVMYYDPAIMQIGQVNMIYNDNLTSAVGLGNQAIFLLTDNAVYEYNPVYNNYGFFTLVPYEICRYDYLHDDVFLVKDKTVSCFDRVSGLMVHQEEFEHDVTDFQVVFNK